MTKEFSHWLYCYSTNIEIIDTYHADNLVVIILENNICRIEGYHVVEHQDQVPLKETQTSLLPAKHHLKVRTTIGLCR
jgi:hypothetical protein